MEPCWKRRTTNTVEQLNEHILRSGVMNADDISCFLTLCATHSVHYATAGMASIWGRRPLAPSSP